MHSSRWNWRVRSSRSCSCCSPRATAAPRTSCCRSCSRRCSSSARSSSSASSETAGCDGRLPLPDLARRRNRARLLRRPPGDPERDRPAALRRRRDDARPGARGGRRLRARGLLHHQRPERDRRRGAARAAGRRALDRDRARDPAARARDAGVDRRRAGARLVIPLQAMGIAILALFAPPVVLARDPVRLALAASLYALALVVLFLVFQAPDVALSELVVGAVAFPLVIVVGIVMQRGS